MTRWFNPQDPRAAAFDLVTAALLDQEPRVGARHPPGELRRKPAILLRGVSIEPIKFGGLLNEAVPPKILHLAFLNDQGFVLSTRAVNASEVLS